MTTAKTLGSVHKLSLSEELMNLCIKALPHILNAARDLKSIIFSHGTSARHFLHRCIQCCTLIPTPGADSSSRAGSGVPKVTEITGWGTVPNHASHERAHHSEKLPHVHRFSLNSWPPTRDACFRAGR